MAAPHTSIEHHHPNTSRMNYWGELQKLRTSYYMDLFSRGGYDFDDSWRAATTIVSAMDVNIWYDPNRDPAYRHNRSLRIARPKTVLSFDNDHRLTGYVYYADEASSERGQIGALLEQTKTLYLPTERQKNQRKRVILEAILPSGEANFGLQAVMLGVALRSAGHGPFEFCAATGERDQEGILIDAGAHWDIDAEPIPILPSLPNITTLPLVAPDASKLYETIAGVQGSHMRDMVEAARKSAYRT